MCLATRVWQSKHSFALENTFKIMRFFLTATALLAGTASAFSPAVVSTRSTTHLKMALSQDELKKQVGYKAVDDYVKSGTVVGLGKEPSCLLSVSLSLQLFTSLYGFNSL